VFSGDFGKGTSPPPPPPSGAFTIDSPLVYSGAFSQVQVYDISSNPTVQVLSNTTGPLQAAQAYCNEFLASNPGDRPVAQPGFILPQFYENQLAQAIFPGETCYERFLCEFSRSGLTIVTLGCHEPVTAQSQPPGAILLGVSQYINLDYIPAYNSSCLLALLT
jgi:hypothetical protein